jgi:lysophospholipase L1-like esterase
MKPRHYSFLTIFFVLLGCAKENNQQDLKPGIEIIAWGDSLTKGLGDKNAYPYMLQQLSSIKVDNRGISGETSTQIKARMISDTAGYKKPVIIWAGRNNLTHPQTVKADIDSMVSKLGHQHYVILGVLNADKTNEYSGTSKHDIVVKLNADLAAKYSDHFIDIRSILIAGYDPQSPLDVENFNNDVPPHSLRLDYVHLTVSGYKIVAKSVYEKINLLTN